MQPEPLHAYVKGRIIDEASDDEQRDLLKVILHSCGPKRKNEKSSEPATIPCGDLEVANKLFSSRKCLPRIYCYLAFCLKILEISAKGKRDWSSTARLWGYMFWSASDAEALADFTQALREDWQHFGLDVVRYHQHSKTLAVAKPSRQLIH